MTEHSDKSNESSSDSSNDTDDKSIGVEDRIAALVRKMDNKYGTRLREGLRPRCKQNKTPKNS